MSKGKDDHAGIQVTPGNELIINGGKVVAAGGDGGAGIGGSNVDGKTFCGTVTVNDGWVEVGGGKDGAGIGGSAGGDGGTVTVNGGRVLAHGGEGKGVGESEGKVAPAGIGGGSYGNGGTLNFNGGTLEAWGGEKKDGGSGEAIGKGTEGKSSGRLAIGDAMVYSSTSDNDLVTDGRESAARGGYVRLDGFCP